MYVNHSGWSEDIGSFSYDIYMDENKTDYEIRYADGSVDRQVTPFEAVTNDWNNDGDVYTMFGAYFEHNTTGWREFMTPESMVMLLLNSRFDPRSVTGPLVTEIPGIEIPDRDKRPTLEQTIQEGERRALHRDAERNRKMDALGIRPPNEPWAR